MQKGSTEGKHRREEMARAWSTLGHVGRDTGNGMNRSTRKAREGISWLSEKVQHV